MCFHCPTRWHFITLILLKTAIGVYLYFFGHCFSVTGLNSEDICFQVRVGSHTDPFTQEYLIICGHEVFCTWVTRLMQISPLLRTDKAHATNMYGEPHFNAMHSPHKSSSRWWLIWIDQDLCLSIYCSRQALLYVWVTYMSTCCAL
jgi:hypothetical protein